MSGITLESDALRVTVKPHVGGTIAEVVHRASGLSVLGRVPWKTVDAPIMSFAARNEPEWLTRYTGGWPLLFPNGGNACEVDGMFHGFHGEASIAPWDADVAGARATLNRQFMTVPVEMRREISVEGEMVIVRERLRMTGSNPVDVMWGHHPTFGSDLLAGPFEITAGNPRVTVDGGYDPPTNPLRPGAAGQWPIVAGKSGDADLRWPASPQASLVYLYDFEATWAAIRRLDNAIAVALSWEGSRFPCAWLWHELEGTPGEPWNGRTRLIGIEPNTTRSAAGLADAKLRGSGVLRLQPGVELGAEIRLHVFAPSGAVSGVTAEGYAIC